MTMRMLCGLVAGAIAVLAACSGEQAGAADVAMADPKGSATEVKSGPGLPEKLATRPQSPCDWIPASEVEAVVGKLSGPPREQEGGCFYPLPVDSITRARRAKADTMRAALEKMGMKSDWPAEPEDTGGVFIDVSVGVNAEERPSDLAFTSIGSWVGNDSLLAARQPANGWQYNRRIIGKPNFWGRAGTVSVWVQGGTSGMDDEVLATLAARVRDRIPDLPFVEPSGAARVPPGRRDPCSVLSREEAEAVLGKLVVAPYRVRKGGALADAGGDSCAYYTGKHRALVLTPYFAGGADEMRFARGGGGLAVIGIRDPQAEGADTLEGPWDEVAMGLYGELAMLKGDRMLELAFLTSSTDLKGAMQLAVPALRRLAAAK